MATTKIKETEAYTLYQDDAGVFYAHLEGGISTGTVGCASELEAVTSLLVYQRDLVNERNMEQFAIRRALPQAWLAPLWQAGDERGDKVEATT